MGVGIETELASVSVLYADIVLFLSLCAKKPDIRVIKIDHRKYACYSVFSERIVKYNRPGRLYA
jgi:hypothetical protein